MSLPAESVGRKMLDVGVNESIATVVQHVSKTSMEKDDRAPEAISGASTIQDIYTGILDAGRRPPTGRYQSARPHSRVGWTTRDDDAGASTSEDCVPS